MTLNIRLSVIARSIAAAVMAGSFAVPLYAQNLTPLNDERSLAASPTEGLYKVSLNGTEFPTAFLLVEDAAELFVSAKDIRAFGLRSLPSKSIMREGERYVSLSCLPGAEVQIDRAAQSIKMKIDPSALEGTQTTMSGTDTVGPENTATGALLNYNLLTTEVGGRSLTTGTLEGRLLSRFGIGSTSYSLQGSETGSSRRLVRLESNWLIDMPSKVQTLKLGDSYQRIGDLGQSVRFAGVSFGTNFDLQPGLITSPLEAVSGVATLPSIVDIYVNQKLTGSRPVAPGPFSITDIPVISGTGELSVVVRDMQGREQLVSRPYQASQNLLGAGRSDYSIEVGLARQNFGLRDFDYGPFTSSFYLRHGVTNYLTAEGRAYQVGRDFAAGIGAVASTGPRLGGIVQLRLVGTQAHEPREGAKATSGVQVGASYGQQPSFDRSSRLTYQIDANHYTRGFKLPGTEASISTPANDMLVTAGYRIGHGQINASYLARREYASEPSVSAPSTRIASLSYMFEAAGGFVSITASNATGSQKGATFYATLMVPLGKPRANSAPTNRVEFSPTSFSTEYLKSAGSGAVASATLARDYPAAEGIGYHVTTRSDGRKDVDATWSRPEATYSMQVSQSNGQTGTRLGVGGTVGVVEGHSFASRPINNGFAVVEAGDFENVPIYRDNNLISHTDRDGVAIVPGLVPYVRNVISTDANAFPMGTKIDALSRGVVPYQGGASVVRLGVKRTHAGTMTVVDAHGLAMPVGSVVKDDRGTEMMVGYDGEVFIEDLDVLTREGGRLFGTSDSKECSVSIPRQKLTKPITDLGEVQCVR